MAPKKSKKVVDIAEHLIPWRFDLTDPNHAFSVNRNCHFHTLISWRKEFKVHRKILKKLRKKKTVSNPYAEIDVPAQFIVGEQDTRVFNQRTKDIYDVMSSG